MPHDQKKEPWSRFGSELPHFSAINENGGVSLMNFRYGSLWEATRTIEINISNCLLSLILEEGPFVEYSERNNRPSLMSYHGRDSSALDGL